MRNQNEPKSFWWLIMAVMVGYSHLLYAQSARENLLQPFRWRSIGPSTMMGRVSCLDALDDDYQTVLVGSASGGVFKSTNAGRTWEIIFDKYGSSSIGYVAFFQKDPSIIWVGTGEGNNRNSSGWGDGVYKSTDGGKTFEHMGLKDTHQIARILTHPTDPDILYVAAVGHLWGYSGDRGLFKTADGGKTWTKLTNGLPDDGKTGCTEIVLHPDRPDVLFCGMYHRLRQPWDMYSGGPNGGIFKSTDAGKTWRKITKGLPAGQTGRIGIDIYRSNPDIMVACVEASDKLPYDLNIPGTGIYRSEDGGESWKYLFRHASRPMYHGRIAVNPLDDNLIYVIARDYRFSDDGGLTFRGKPWRGAGGDDHDLWISPRDKNVFYVATDQGCQLTEDGGKTFTTFNNMAIGQYYAIGVDMRDPYWVYGGLQDNGGWAVPGNSRDRSNGILVDHTIEVNGGDGFHMQVDPTDWRTVYTTCHVGGWGRVNMETYEHKFISPLPHTIVNYSRFFDPDFEETYIDYTIDPGEHWLWSDIPAERRNARLGPQFRFNWNSPVIISPHNPYTIYVAGNYIFKSVDRGDTWRIISPDLTTNDPAKRNSSQAGGLTREVTGAENHCTIITLSESPLDPAILWAGADDGNVQVTRDGGSTWQNVTANIRGLPPGLWCSRVEASHFDPATCYVSIDGHRSDDFNPYVFKTTDFGQTWTGISSNLPDGHSVHVVKEDLKNPNLLFVGTEFACFATVDGGKSWARLMGNMPTVAFRDLVIHPRDHDLVAGTHGRSIWILDDITPLQQLTDEVLASEVHLFEPRVTTQWLNISRGRVQPYLKFRGENPPAEVLIHFYLKSAPQANVRIDITDPFNPDRTRPMSIEAKAGINQIQWDMTFSGGRDFPAEADAGPGPQRRAAGPGRRAAPPETGADRQRRGMRFGRRSTPAEPGAYLVTLTVDGKTFNQKITIRKDPLLDKEY